MFIRYTFQFVFIFWLGGRDILVLTITMIFKKINIDILLIIQILGLVYLFLISSSGVIVLFVRLYSYTTYLLKIDNLIDSIILFFQNFSILR